MKHISKSQLNVLQNLIISFLSVSALTLFLLLQMDFRPAELLSALFPAENTVLNGSSTAESPVPLQNTVRLAVSGDYGRHGSIHLTNTALYHHNIQIFQNTFIKDAACHGFRSFVFHLCQQSFNLFFHSTDDT